MNRNTAGAISISVVLAVMTVAVSLDNVYLRKEKLQLSMQYENSSKELSALTQKFSDFQQQMSEVQWSPPIETRLGIKIMNTRYSQNHLWVTGQVENIENLTLYNAKLRFNLATANGTDVKEYVIGTMQGHQTVNVRYAAFSSLGMILSWKMETIATYRP